MTNSKQAYNQEVKKSKGMLSNENLFIDGPVDYLVRHAAYQLRQVKQWRNLFTAGIEGYKRMDFSMRGLPGLRIYIDDYRKTFESWFINGDITLDVILPAYIRRYETEDYAGQIANALLQQFRRDSFFNTLRSSIPGLNELGKEFSVDKSLGFAIGDDVVPLTQIKANFRIDLREWDSYLEQTDRTKDSPFEKVLGNLEQIAFNIQGIEDDLDTENPNIEIETQIKKD